jgi:hypothetical protein
VKRTSTGSGRSPTSTAQLARAAPPLDWRVDAGQLGAVSGGHDEQHGEAIAAIGVDREAHQLADAGLGPDHRVS